MKKLLVQIFLRLPTPVLLILVVTQSYAQDYRRFVSMMPNTNEVSKKITTDNIYTTYVKQAGAFEQLRMMLKAVDGNRTNSLTNEEKHIDDEYSKAYNQLVYKAQLPDEETRGYLTNERVKLLSRYSMNRSFRDELYEFFFDTEFKNSVEPLVQEQLLYGNYTPEAITTRRKEEQDKKEQEANITNQSHQPNFMSKLQGIIMIAIGVFILFKGNKLGHNALRNQFERRNSSGIEEFSSYDDMVKKRRSEGLQGCTVQIALIGGIFLILAGLGIFFFS